MIIIFIRMPRSLCRIILYFIVVLCVTNSASAGTRLLLSAEKDTSVFEATPDRAQGASTRHLLSAGIGQGMKVGKLVSYIKFDLSELPESGLLYYFTIDTGKLQLLAQSFGLANLDHRFFVTVSSCMDSDWSESKMNWNTRVCQDDLAGEDSIVVDGNQLPNIYSWDVTRGISNARLSNDQKITFVVDGFLLLLKEGAREIVSGERFGPDEEVGFVRFWSRERVKYGANAIPTLKISYSRHPTALLNFLNYLIALLSAVGVIVGLYKTVLQKEEIKGASR